MKKILCCMYISVFCLSFVACNNGRTNNEASKSGRKNTHNTVAMEDTVKIGNALRENVLVNELDLLRVDQRKYSLDGFDLNEDGNLEYFVGFENDFFRQADGCTYFILNNDGSLNSRIVGSYAPFIILSTKTDGWHDLLINSNEADHKLSFNKKSYPSHPWTLPIIHKDSVIKNNHFLKIVLEGKADYTF